MILTPIIINILMFLFSFSSLSFGEWEKVTQTRDKVMTLYLDYKTLKKVDGYTLIWSLDDLSKKMNMVLSLTSLTTKLIVNCIK